MKTIISALVASTALTAAVGWSASAAIGSATNADTRPIIANAHTATPPIILADNDDDDDHRSHRRHGDDDDDEEDDDGCDDDDDDDDCIGSARNPAPAGTVAPPSNRLFENGAAPQVQVN